MRSAQMILMDLSTARSSSADLERRYAAMRRLTEDVEPLLAAIDALAEYDHADTCGSMLSPLAGYPCSCWRAALAAVPSPAVTPEPSTLDRMMWHCIEPDCEWGWSQIIAWINRNGGKARYKVNGQLFDTPETRNITTPLIAIRTPTGWDCYVAPGDTVVVGDDWFDPAGLASICLGIRSFSVERAVTPEPRPGPVLRDVPRLPATAALDHCGTCHRPLPHNEVESHACRAVPVETTEDR